MFNPIGDGTSTEAHYNAQGSAYLYTSYADTAGTQIVNQVENIYPGAAAHARRMGGTGFRGVEEVFPGRRASPLNAGPVGFPVSGRERGGGYFHHAGGGVYLFKLGQRFKDYQHGLSQMP